MVNDVRKLITALSHPTKDKVAFILASRGHEFDEELGEHAQTNIELYASIHPFVVAVAQSLSWAEYVLENEKTFQLVNEFIDGNKSNIDNTDDILWRREKQSVVDVLVSWKLLLSHVQLNGLPRQFSAVELLKFQERLVEQAVRLSTTKRIKGVGAWILLAPFKVLAALRSDLWKDDTLNNILFPLGAQVVNGFHFVNGKVGLRGLSDLSENERDLSIDIATTTLVQKNIEQELTSLVDSNILHINSGLFLAGSKV